MMSPAFAAYLPAAWERDILQDTIQQRINIIRRLLPVGAHPVIFCRTVNNGEIQLVFRCFQAEHQVEYHS